MENKLRKECVFLVQKRIGIQPINQILEQTGISDEEIDDLSKQMKDFIQDMNISDLVDNMPEEFTNSANPFLGIFNKNLFRREGNKNSKNSEINEEKDGGRDFKNNKKIRTQEKKATKRKKYLDTYGDNLTEKARNNEIDRIIGRDKEIDRIIQILNRRNKNNPVLIGEPGVGKTAIAEGLAVKIVQREVPVKLFNMEVYLLDLTSVVAGTQFRGQFESRMKGIIEEAKTLGNIILVIDELHNIIGAGEAEGAMNAANILKPALAKGEIQVIGATTLNEYRKYVEKDAALERRFQPVIIEEPSIEETIEILRGIKDYYEDFHRVKITDEIIKLTVNLSEGISMTGFCRIRQ